MVTGFICVLGFLLGFSIATFWHFAAIEKELDVIKHRLHRTEDRCMVFEHFAPRIMKDLLEVRADVKEINTNTKALDSAEAALEMREREIKELETKVRAQEELVKFYRGLYFKE